MLLNIDDYREKIITIETAISLLKEDEVVILPTETVYGLAGNAYSHIAAKKIFDKKERPYGNPLIIHYASIEQAKADVFFTSTAEALANHYWPGPLTIVLPIKLSSRLSSMTNSNMKTVGIRISAHPILRAIITKFGNPLAMPSANMHQMTSTTNVCDAIYSLKNICAVEGGYSYYGLESTIVDCSKDTPVILRHGAITASMINQHVRTKVIINTEGKKMSGSHKIHYRTNKSIRMNAVNVEKDEGLIAFGDHDIQANICLNLSKSANLKEAARKLFYCLQKLDRSNCTKIAVMPIPNEGIGIAINDRLMRATAIYNNENINNYRHNHHRRIIS